MGSNISFDIIEYTRIGYLISEIIFGRFMYECVFVRASIGQKGSKNIRLLSKQNKKCVTIFLYEF